MRLVCFLVILSFQCAVCVGQDIAPLDLAWLRIESPDADKQANSDLALLEQHLREKDKDTPKAAAALAAFHRLKGGTREYKDVLKVFALTPAGAWNFENPDCCLEYARLIAKDNTAFALQCFDHFGQGSNSELKVLAAEAAGDAMFSLERYQEAIDYYKFAKQYANTDAYAKESKRVEFALARIEADLAKAWRPLDIKKYGEEFVLYREAETYRHWSNWPKALGAYQELVTRFPTTVFAAASEVYGAYCLQKMSKWDEAERRLQRAANGEKWGLYRGEALVALGEMRLNQDLDLESATMWFKKADEWLAGIATCGVDFSKQMPPARSADVTKSPADPVFRDNFGNVMHVRPADGALVNHLTTPWYLDSLRMRVAASYGFVLMVSGKVDEAKAQFEKYRTLDKVGVETEKRSMGSFSQRMEWDLTHNQGCLRAHPAEAAEFKNSKRKLAMFLGDLAYEKEDWTAAKEEYQMLLNGQFGKLSPGEEAYVWSSLAACEARFDPMNARKMFSVFETKWQKTPSAPRALMDGANLAATKGDDASRKESVRICDLLATRYAGGPYEEEAIFSAGMILFCSPNQADVSLGRKRLEYYVQRYPNGWWKNEASKEFLDFLDGLKKRSPDALEKLHIDPNELKQVAK